MKNKKLFAILTLVCFMFTLMPVAAFAAGEYGSIADEFTAVKTGEKVEVAVNTAGTYYVYAVKDGELAKVAAYDGTGAAGTATTTGTAIGISVVKEAIAANGVIEVEFAKPGEYTIGVAKAESALVAVVEGGSLVAPATVLANLNTFKIDMLNNAVSVDSAAAAYQITAVNPHDTGVTATNGFDKAHQEIKLTTVVGSVAIPNADLEIVTDSYAINVVKVDAKTRADGSMRFYVTGTIPGTYNVYVKHPAVATDYTFAVTVSPASIDEVVTVAQPSAPQDVTSADTVNSGIVFAVKDSTGYAYKDATPLTMDDVIADGSANDYIVSVLEAPKGFSKTQNLQLAYNASGNTKNVGWEIVDGDVATPTPVLLDKEGTYTFQIALANGSKATASVTVAKFDKAVALKFVDAPVTVPYGGTTAVAPSTVYEVDADGVQRSAGIAQVTANGKAIQTFTTTSGALTIKNDEKYIGSKVTVLAVKGDLVATHEVTVTEDAATIVYANTEVAVGANNTLAGTVFDADGKFVAVSGTAQVIVIDKPANAVVTTSATSGSPATVTNGKFTVGFLASAAGEYTIQTIITSGSEYISDIATITVGGAEGQFKDVVVMSIGAANIVVNSDVKAIAAAPMIQDGRTFVPFRALAEAFGAEVEWVEATQSVVAELNGVKVVMVIGANEYTVNGAAKTADVAPFINGASTMVPVRFVAEAFGINVTPIAAADGSVADVLFAK